MPIAAPRPCGYPGCSELVTGGSRCELHRKQQRKQQDQRRDRGQRFYDKRAWRDRIRPQQLARHPLCEDCLDRGQVTAATDVDHMDGNPHNNSADNLRSLCHACHSRKTVRQDGGFGN